MTTYAHKLYTILFNEDNGYFFVRYIGNPSQGQVMLVRSARDQQLYIRKVGWPTMTTLNPNPEIALYRPHSTIPRLISHKQYPGPPQKAVPGAFHPEEGPTAADAMVFEYCNGGDLGTVKRNVRGKFPDIFVAHVMERLLRAVYFLQSERNPPIAHCDIASRNVFLHWTDNTLPKIFLGDYGFAEEVMLDSKKAQTGWDYMMKDWIHVGRIIRNMIKAGQPEGWTIEDSPLYEPLIRITRWEEPSGANHRQNHAAAQEHLRDVIDNVREIMAQIPRPCNELAGIQRLKHLSCPINPTTAYVAEVLHMMHPKPMGPFKIVEYQDSNGILEVVREVEEIDTKFALNVTEYGRQ
jgi:serine/threonine protein kinase